MLSVEHQKKRRSPKKWVWLLLALVLLALCLGTYFILRARYALPQTLYREMGGGTITNYEEDELLSMTVSSKDGESWTLIRNESGEWCLEGEENQPISETLMDQLSDAVCNLVYEDILTEDTAEYADRLADFGLEEPALRVSATFSNDRQLQFSIGSESGLADESFCYMLLEGDERLYAVASSLAEDLSLEKHVLSDITQPVMHQVLLDEITVLSATGEKTLSFRLKGQVTDSDAGENWQMTVPWTYPADSEVIANLKENAEDLRFSACLGEATADLLTECGLDQPKASLELHMAAGSTGTVSDSGVYDVTEWPETTLCFQIGNAKNEMTTWVLYEGSVYTMNSFVLNVFLEAEPLSCVARYPVLTPLDSLSSLQIDAIQVDGTVETTLYTLSRTAETQEDGSTITQNSCMKNGEALEYTVFEAWYQRMLVVTVSGKLPSDFATGTVHTVYTFTSGSGMVHTLALSSFDVLHDAVTLDGCSLFYLIKEGLPELP